VRKMGSEWKLKEIKIKKISELSQSEIKNFIAHEAFIQDL